MATLFERYAETAGFDDYREWKAANGPGMGYDDWLETDYAGHCLDDWIDTMKEEAFHFNYGDDGDGL